MTDTGAGPSSFDGFSKHRLPRDPYSSERAPPLARARMRGNSDGGVTMDQRLASRMDEMNRVREVARRDIQAFLEDTESEAADVLATGALQQQVAGLRNVLRGGRGADKPAAVQLTQKLRAASSQQWQQLNAGSKPFSLS